jgi:hypothetical protein
MSMTYTMRGKTAITHLDMGEATDIFGETGRRVLEIETDKGFRKDVRTSASVFLHKTDGSKSHVFGSGTEGDFSATLKSTPCTRVTEKVIRAQHEAMMGEFAAVLERAKVFYFARERKEAFEAIKTAGIGTPL